MGNKLKFLKIKIHLVFKEFFQYSLVTYLVLLLAETLKQGIVSFFFNLNILLVIVLISGLIMTVTYSEMLDERLNNRTIISGIKIKDAEYIFILTAVVSLLVWYETQDLGFLSITITILTAIMIVLISILVLLYKEN